MFHDLLPDSGILYSLKKENMQIVKTLWFYWNNNDNNNLICDEYHNSYIFSYTKLVNNTEHFLRQIAFRLRESVITGKGVFNYIQKEIKHSYDFQRM